MGTWDREGKTRNKGCVTSELPLSVSGPQSWEHILRIIPLEGWESWVFYTSTPISYIEDCFWGYVAVNLWHLGPVLYRQRRTVEWEKVLERGSQAMVLYDPKDVQRCDRSSSLNSRYKIGACSSHNVTCPMSGLHSEFQVLVTINSIFIRKSLRKLF